MKILFSNPPWWAPDGDKGLRQGRRAGSRWPFTIPASFRPDQFRPGSYFPFPFFMGYAASYVQKAFPKDIVIFRDSIARGESYYSYQKFIKELAPDVVFIESATSSWGHDRNVISFIRDWLPKVDIVLCGPISETNVEELYDCGVLACIKGEYEKNAVKVLNGAHGLIPNDLLSVKEMNEAPIPMMDELCWDHYWDANPLGQEYPHLQVWASRGCPYKCCFCVWPAVMTGNDPDGTKPRSVRFYSPEYMENYLKEMLVRHPQLKTIYFDDDTFNLQEKHTLEMCEVMDKIKKPWGAMCRADTISRDAWKRMKESGCTGVKLGFESGSQEVIDSIVNKKLDLKEAADTSRFIKSIGMGVHGTFTVGLPGETDIQRKETYDFIKNLYETGGLDTHQLSGTAEIEGTPLANMKSGEALKAYPKAIKDDSYKANPDGMMKMEHMPA